MESKALVDVLIERGRQKERWLDPRMDDQEWLPILVEEVGETAKAIGEGVTRDGETPRDELVQVAAVAIGWIEDIDRRACGG